MCPILLTTLATFAQATESVEPLVFDPATPDAGLELGHAADPKKGLTLPVFHDQHFAHRDTPFVLDPDCVVLPLELQAAEGRFQPMIQEGETGFVPSPHFTGMAKTLGIMNKLAYSRGQDYRNGHELTYQGSLDGWTLTNIKAKRGWGSDDPNAGFVAYHKGLRTIAIVMHGSINGADWITNFKTWAVRLDAPHPLPRRADEGDGAPVRFARLPFVGFAHKGFLEKYLSASEEVMEAVDRILAAPDLTTGEKQDLKFYVSGHSQGAALSQLLTLHLCLHLRKHYGPEFVNARDNRVHAWLLASPTGLDETAAAFAEGWIGKANIVVQNTWLDPVPNVGLNTDLVFFKALGTPIMQSTAAAIQRSAKAHREAAATHYANGDYSAAVNGAVYVDGLMASVGARIKAGMLSGTLPVDRIMDGIRASLKEGLWGMVKSAGYAQHMGTDNVNYRGVGKSYAFDPDMVDQSLQDLKQGLQMAYDHQQDRLRAQAVRANPNTSSWERFKAWMK